MKFECYLGVLGELIWTKLEKPPSECSMQEAPSLSFLAKS